MPLCFGLAHKLLPGLTYLLPAGCRNVVPSDLQYLTDEDVEEIGVSRQSLFQRTLLTCLWQFLQAVF